MDDGVATPVRLKTARSPGTGPANAGEKQADGRYPSLGPQSVDQSETDNWMQLSLEHQLG